MHRHPLFKDPDQCQKLRMRTVDPLISFADTSISTIPKLSFNFVFPPKASIQGLNAAVQRTRRFRISKNSHEEHDAKNRVSECRQKCNIERHAYMDTSYIDINEMYNNNKRKERFVFGFENK